MNSFSHWGLIDTESEPLAGGLCSRTIEECAKLLQRWSDDAAEFSGGSVRCEVQANVCRNAARAIRNLARRD